MQSHGIHEHLKGNLQFETLVLKYDNFFRAVDGNTKRYQKPTYLLTEYTGALVLLGLYVYSIYT
jgi:hypothetical protein